jgi:hypothetical protein
VRSDVQISTVESWGAVREHERGTRERYEEMPGPRYPGGAEAKALLHGRRFYAYYERGELLKALDGFTLLTEQRVEPAEGGFKFWLRKTGEAAA